MSAGSNFARRAATTDTTFVRLAFPEEKLEAVIAAAGGWAYVSTDVEGEYVLVHDAVIRWERDALVEAMKLARTLLSDEDGKKLEARYLEARRS